jgi:folate-binding protein YgfZ
MTRTFLLDGAAELAHLGLVRAAGADAATFLHGQLTNDFALLDTHRARLAGYCSPKGRLLASFVAWKTAPDEVLLLCSADVLPATLKRLSMFVLRAQCKLTDATAAYRRLGLAGPSALAWLGDAAPAAVWGRTERDGASVVRLPDAGDTPRFLWVAPEGVAAPELPVLSTEAWKWGEVQSAIPTIESATVDQFVPQMLNYELVGGVDFKKGCYPGQEIVARSQFRGTLKRRTYLVQADAPVSAGQEVFAAADAEQPVGTVAQAAPAPGGGWAALISIQISALETGGLHAGGADGPALTVEPLPYPLLEDI